VVFRAGCVLSLAKRPGIVLVFEPIDRMLRLSLRVEALEESAQDVVTRDNVTVKVNAVIFFRAVDLRLAVLEVSSFLYATSQLAQNTLRSVLGEAELETRASRQGHPCEGRISGCRIVPLPIDLITSVTQALNGSKKL
jgi:regulator of protease activity HflC (stomatin/prohibitin superfamily)